MTNALCPARMVVALDFPTPEQALLLAGKLRGLTSWVKVGLELYLAGGRRLVDELKNMGFSIFLDLKFMDIPNTVQAATAQATAMGVDMLTVHTLGGKNMCEAALCGRDKALLPGQKPPLLMAVTLLTSFGPRDLVWDENATTTSLRELTVRLATCAQAWHMDGVVCSGQEINAIRGRCAPSFRLLTPGIRLSDDAAGDQTRVYTPSQAVRDGSNFLVIGRPVTKASDPIAAAHRYLDAMCAAV